MATRNSKVVAATYPAIDRRHGLQFVKTFTLDTVINVIGVAIVLGLPILYWGRAIDSRMLTLEVTNQMANQEMGRREAELMEQRRLLNTRLETIEKTLQQTQLSLEKLNAQLSVTPSRSR